MPLITTILWIDAGVIWTFLEIWTSNRRSGKIRNVLSHGHRTRRKAKSPPNSAAHHVRGFQYP
jgi:hypothetical protein